MNFAKSRKGFLSAGKFLRKSTASAQISSFRAIRPFGTFWRKSGNFSEAAAKEISAPGMRGAERFRENFGAADVLLRDEELRAMEAEPNCLEPPATVQERF